MAFRGVDYLRIDSLFNEEELLVRQTARQFVDERVLPAIRDCYRDARFPSDLVPEMGRLGFFGANLEGYGCAGMSNVEYGLIMQELERGDSGVRSFVSVQGALVMYPIFTYGSRRTEAAMAAAPAKRRSGRLFRTHRAGLRLEPRRHADYRAARWRRLDPERRENLDHQRHAGRCGHRVGARRGRHPRISGGEGHAGIHVVGYSREVVDAGVGDVQPVAGRLPGSGERDAARGRRG